MLKFRRYSVAHVNFFSFLLFKFFQMLCLDESLLLLKLRSLIDTRHSVPIRGSVNRNVERVVILENHNTGEA